MKSEKEDIDSHLCSVVAERDAPPRACRILSNFQNDAAITEKLKKQGHKLEKEDVDSYLRSVMEKRDIPPRAYEVQKPQEGAGSFWELKAVQHFVLNAIPATNLRGKIDSDASCGSLVVGIKSPNS